MKETARKWTALLLAVWLLVGLAQPTAWATADEVTISSSEEFAEFSKNCSLDTWSQGKTFRLTADINLSAMNFTSIPTFGGTFLGDGHTISGFQIEASGSNLMVYTSMYADFAGTVVPQGKCNITGIFKRYNDKCEILIRKISDVEDLEKQ